MRNVAFDTLPYFKKRKERLAATGPTPAFPVTPLRTCTYGINLMDCIDSDIPRMLSRIRGRIGTECSWFSQAVQNALKTISGQTDIPIDSILQTIRVTTTPAETLLRNAIATQSLTSAQIADFVVEIERAIVSAVETRHIGSGLFIGGAGMVGDYGISLERQAYLNALPTILQSTQYFFVDLVIGSSKSGIHLDSLNAVASVVQQVASNDAVYTQALIPDPTVPGGWNLTPAQQEAFTDTVASVQSSHPNANCWPYFSDLSRLSVFVNAPQDNPYLAGGFAGHSLPERTVSVGINGAADIQQAIAGVMGLDQPTMSDLLVATKLAAADLYAFAETFRAAVLTFIQDGRFPIDEAHGIVDLSIASTADRNSNGTPSNSIGAALASLVGTAGAYGTVGAVGLIIDNLKKVGSGVVTYAGGLSGTFVPITEDAGMGDAVYGGTLTYPRYLALTSVCSVGIDMFAAYWPYSVNMIALQNHLAGLLLDEAAIGVYTNKTTSTRIMPIYDYANKAPLSGSNPINPWIVIMPKVYSSSSTIERRAAPVTSASVGLLGAGPLMDMNFDTLPQPAPLLSLGGALPAPITNLRN